MDNNLKCRQGFETVISPNYEPCIERDKGGNYLKKWQRIGWRLWQQCWDMRQMEIDSAETKLEYYDRWARENIDTRDLIIQGLCDEMGELRHDLAAALNELAALRAQLGAKYGVGDG